MTVENQTFKVTANGNGSATSFSFSPMVLPDGSDQLEVTKLDADGVETVLTEGAGAAHYTVVPTGSYPSTGSITYPSTGATRLETGESIVMRRVLTLEQQTDLENQGGYFPDIQEAQFDRLVMIDLQQQEEIDRSIKVPVSDDPALSTSLPAAELRLGMLFGFDLTTGEPEMVANPATNPELTAIAAISGTGILARTADDTWAVRTITAPAAGITVTNGGGVAGNPTLVLADDLAALEALDATAGLLVKTAADTYARRTLAGTANQITVTNGDGVSGAPTLSLPSTLIAPGSIAATTLTGSTRLVASSASDGVLVQLGGSAATPALRIVTGALGTSGFYSDEANTLKLSAGGGNAASFTSTQATFPGKVTMPLQPAFLANKSATTNNVTGNATVYTAIFDTEVFDQGGDYNNGTGVFTAPVTGKYALTAVLRGACGVVADSFEIQIVTSNRTYSKLLNWTNMGAVSATEYLIDITCLADMDAADTAYVTIKISGEATDNCGLYGNASPLIYFCGNLAC